MHAGPDMATLGANLAQIRQRVDDACRAAGRDPCEVTILPVSKTFGADTLRAALALGLHRFGENRLQEIGHKQVALADVAIEWVVIGPVQTNKAKEVARLAAEVQSLDRLELAEALHHRLQLEGRTIDVLVQVKTSPEANKHGLPPAYVPAFLQQLRNFPSLRVRGLMTLATHSDDPTEVRGCFSRLRGYRDQLAKQGHDLPRLSMGMSGDFPLAIAEGATEVRIGSAIFGRRTT